MVSIFYSYLCTCRAYISTHTATACLNDGYLSVSVALALALSCHCYVCSSLFFIENDVI